ncbi:hypothetical protein SAMN04487897_109156 [Paenibacillus sp. yr247]|uniref:hypothetical protein n=1 Tax=Paenibacillus sp. yr247 TaxID=1761880 RepID=UPI00087ED00D|nr:hypothetical protein [Paenibacillus sp. yr247]SDO19019.1 hypothetical protein SAMN04487897_109156 [Paenibacillus sp. yr247]
MDKKWTMNKQFKDSTQKAAVSNLVEEVEQRDDRSHPSVQFRMGMFRTQTPIAYNGFITGFTNDVEYSPFFTRAESDRVIQLLETEDFKFRYDESIDAYWVSLDGEKDCDIHYPVDINVNGVTLHVYPIGAGYVVWEENREHRYYLNVDAETGEEGWIFFHDPDRHREEDNILEVYNDPCFSRRRFDKMSLLMITKNEYDELFLLHDKPEDVKF